VLVLLLERLPHLERELCQEITNTVEGFLDFGLLEFD
jgi:hypothetical protein